jgi:hypothetical protein|tara:strand:+ start:710 stop:820 length:111 start_codon:yes stop_codon:yes gene_type:complete
MHLEENKGHIMTRNILLWILVVVAILSFGITRAMIN